MAVNPEQDFVLKTIKSRDVHFVRFWFTDVLGAMKSFAVIPSELDQTVCCHHVKGVVLVHCNGIVVDFFSGKDLESEFFKQFQVLADHPNMCNSFFLLGM